MSLSLWVKYNTIPRHSNTDRLIINPPLYLWDMLLELEEEEEEEEEVGS